MSEASRQLQQRRLDLVARASQQRRLIAADIEPWRQPLALVDRGLGVLGLVRRHPVVSVGAALLLTALPLGRGGLWLRRGWVAWRLVQSLRGR